MKTSLANAEPDAVKFFWGYVNDEGGVLFAGQRLYGMGHSVKWRSAKWAGQRLYGMGRNVKWGTHTNQSASHNSKLSHVLSIHNNKFRHSR